MEKLKFMIEKICKQIKPIWKTCKTMGYKFCIKVMAISLKTIQNIAIYPIAILFFNSFSPIQFKIFNGITHIEELKNEFYALILFIIAVAISYYLIEGFKLFIKKYWSHLKREWLELKEQLRNAGQAKIKNVIETPIAQIDGLITV